ncbi:MAG TPA: hypothetical protein VGD07_10330 [Methylomirabilota bacterium]
MSLDVSAITGKTASRILFGLARENPAVPAPEGQHRAARLTSDLDDAPPQADTRADAVRSDDRTKSWWHTLPGVLTAIAGVVTAVAGLVVALGQVGLLGGGDDARKPPASAREGPTSAATTPPADAPRPVTRQTVRVFKGDKGKPVPTGLRVGDGDRFIISASGSIWSGVVLTSENGPQGWFDAVIPRDRVAGREFPVPGRPPFSLIAGYDNRDWFYVGSAYDHTYRGPERDLWLSINDTNLSRGKGFFEVRVEIRRRAR